jgi:hypothetical protein
MLVPELRKDLLFLKKKKQKDFYPFGLGARRGRAEGIEVFWFFFSKKNMLPVCGGHEVRRYASVMCIAAGHQPRRGR